MKYYIVGAGIDHITEKEYYIEVNSSLALVRPDVHTKLHKWYRKHRRGYTWECNESGLRVRIRKGK